MNKTLLLLACATIVACTHDFEVTRCGDGTIQAGEECDGANLNAQSCASLGMGDGDLTCSSTCELVTTGCSASTCGNGAIDSGEQCDGSNLGGQTCATLGMGTGTVSCSSSCQLVTTGCSGNLCGNSVIDGTEQCDGAMLGSASCVSLGHDYGTLACGAACMFDQSSCVDCGAGQSACGSACFDLTTDLNHCGGCATTCNSASVCTDSACVAPQLHAVRPETVQVGQTITLEGIFGATATVSFTGASPVAATVLGTQRAVVTVPIGASTGNVTVTTRGVTTAPQRVRVATFALTLNTFRKSYEQAGHGEQTPTPLEARLGAMAVRAGHWLYLLGGSVSGTPTSTIERALVNGDGSLGPFQSAGNLTSSRAYASAIRVGDKLVISGGASGAGNTPVASLEEATIAADGTLSAFTARGDSLANARIGHTSVVIGRWVYVIGGDTAIERAPITGTGVGTFAAVNSTLSSARTRAVVVVTGGKVVVAGGEAGSPLSTIEQATIDGDGDLGAFATSATALGSARTGASGIIIANALYLLGGNNGAQDIATVEKATIAADGTLQAFSSVPSLTTNRRSAATAVVDNFLYVFDGTSVTSLERASLIGNHSLSAFGADLETMNGTFRTLFARGDNLYHLTGSRATPENGMARATISSTGVPGAFTSVSIAGVPPGRNTPAVAVIGTKTYVMGGTYNSSPTTCCLVSASVSVSNADAIGNVGNFADAGVTMTVTREAPAPIVIGNYLYVIGGSNDNGTHTAIERSQIDAAGTLTGFGAGGTSLVTGRTYAGAVLLGDKLYVIGGQTNGGVAGSLEVATVNGTSVGAFANAGVSLVTPRFFPGVAVIGNQLYVFGGNSGSATLTSVERATIDANNNVGAFSTVAGLTSPSLGAILLQNNLVVGPFVQLATLQ